MRWPALRAGTFAAVLAAAARFAAAADDPVPSIRDSVTAGETVVVAWGALPERADEFEILLSVDGGGRTAIRATASLAPSTRAIEWRVPNLPASRARVRIRWGDGAREIESPWSEPFEIRRARAGRVEPLHRDGAEIALGPGAGPPLDGPPAAAPIPAVSPSTAPWAASVRTIFTARRPARVGSLANATARQRPSFALSAPAFPPSLAPLRL